LAKFCLHGSRVFIQINQFLDESGFFKDSKFVIDGKDIQASIRNEIKGIKE